MSQRRMSNLSTFTIFKRMMIKNSHMHLLSQDEIQFVQQMLLMIMDDIHDFCRGHGISYVMCGGAALGSARHGGFIPWDDDIDLCMPRRDYDRFRDLFISECSDKYFVQEIRVSPKYDLNFMKVRLKGTTFLEPLDTEPDKAGIFIDILPIENVYNSCVLRILQWFLSDGLQFISSCVRIRKKRELLLGMAGDDEEAIKAIRLKSLIALPFSIIPLRAWLLITEKVLNMDHDDKSALVSIPTGGLHFKGDMYQRETLLPPREVSFEGRSYLSMNDLNGYLKIRYGDYMTLPPAEKREQHALSKFELSHEFDSKKKMLQTQ